VKEGENLRLFGPAGRPLGFPTTVGDGGFTTGTPDSSPASNSGSAARTRSSSRPSAERGAPQLRRPHQPRPLGRRGCFAIPRPDRQLPPDPGRGRPRPGAEYGSRTSTPSPVSLALDGSRWLPTSSTSSRCGALMRGAAGNVLHPARWDGAVVKARPTSVSTSPLRETWITFGEQPSGGVDVDGDTVRGAPSTWALEAQSIPHDVGGVSKPIIRRASNRAAPTTFSLRRRPATRRFLRRVGGGLLPGSATDKQTVRFPGAARHHATCGRC